MEVHWNDTNISSFIHIPFQVPCLAVPEEEEEAENSDKEEEHHQVVQEEEE